MRDQRWRTIIILDTLTKTREGVPNLALGVNSDQVLNDAPDPGITAMAGTEIAREIKRAVNALNVAAITDVTLTYQPYDWALNSSAA